MIPVNLLQAKAGNIPVLQVTTVALSTAVAFVGTATAAAAAAGSMGYTMPGADVAKPQPVAVDNSASGSVSIDGDATSTSVTAEAETTSADSANDIGSTEADSFDGPTENDENII